VDPEGGHRDCGVPRVGDIPITNGQQAAFFFSHRGPIPAEVRRGREGGNGGASLLAMNDDDD
jgi:hypothetical protein